MMPMKYRRDPIIFAALLLLFGMANHFVCADFVCADDEQEQKPVAFDYQGAVDDIRIDELQTHLGWLAAPEQQGRNSGTDAGHRAGDYLVVQLAQLGLEPAGTDDSFMQGFRFRDGEPRYRNVLGIVRGSDPELANEYIMVCAHYDHIGVINNTTYPGANDNASGTSMVLELTESLQKLEPRPKRSVIVAFWDAEEKGLLGSMYFANNPTLSLEKIKVVFNFDMVGTLQNNTFEIFGSNIATGMREFISRQLTADDPDIDFSTEYLLASDHSSLYAKKIPALMFFTGLDCPYHEPEDTYDIIDFEGMKQIADIAFRVVFQLADADDLAFVNYISPREMRRDVEKHAESFDFNIAQTMGLTFASDSSDEDASSADPQFSLGKTLGQFLGNRMTQGNNSLRVIKVAKGSVAEQVGIKRGDRIMTLNGRDISGGATKFDEKIASTLREEPNRAIYLRVLRSRESQQWLRLEITSDDLVEVNKILRTGFLYRESVAEPETIIVSLVFSDKVTESGLKPHDRIMRINGERASAESLDKAMTIKRPLLLEIERNGKISELELAL